MKLLLFVFGLVAAVYARPDLSGSYLPGVTGGSTILSSSFVGQPGGFISGLDTGLSGSISGGYQGHQDQRHVFFYAAPDDEPAARLRVQIAPSSHRNTKIIFVKAPSSGGVIPEVIAPPSQAEDKTVVYVLVKKQQQGGAITIPSSLGVKQAKPEVYFIKYRNQHEAEQAVLGGLNGQSIGSGLSDLGSEGAFVRTLKVQGTGLGLGDGSGFGSIGGYDTGISSGSNILGTAIGGTPGGVYKESVGTVRYGTPGASGPYKR